MYLKRASSDEEVVSQIVGMQRAEDLLLTLVDHNENRKYLVVERYCSPKGNYECFGRFKEVKTPNQDAQWREATFLVDPELDKRPVFPSFEKLQKDVISGNPDVLGFELTEELWRLLRSYAPLRYLPDFFTEGEGSLYFGHCVNSSDDTPFLSVKFGQEKNSCLSLSVYDGSSDHEVAEEYIDCLKNLLNPSEQNILFDLQSRMFYLKKIAFFLHISGVLLPAISGVVLGSLLLAGVSLGVLGSTVGQLSLLVGLSAVILISTVADIYTVKEYKSLDQARQSFYSELKLTVASVYKRNQEEFSTNLAP